MLLSTKVHVAGYRYHVFTYDIFTIFFPQFTVYNVGEIFYSVKFVWYDIFVCKWFSDTLTCELSCDVMGE